MTTSHANYGSNNDDNAAIVIGNDSQAGAGLFGDNNDDNTAVAIGTDSGASAGANVVAVSFYNNNTGNKALAINGGTALAGFNGSDNDNNSATAFGPDSLAAAGGGEVFGLTLGNFNTGNEATATQGGEALAGVNGDFSDNNTATASDAGSLASAGSVGFNLDDYDAAATGGQTDVQP